jgi:kynureninase
MRTEGILTVKTAVRLEAEDPVASLRQEFAVPPWEGGREAEWAYFAGNSLGLMPLAARAALGRELDSWARLGVEAWFEGSEPWLEYARSLRAQLARLVGATEDEVAVVHGLTINLHLLLSSFYEPTPARYRILIEDAAFPSDSHAVQSHVAVHGLDPRDAVVKTDADGVLATIESEGERLAVIVLGGLNYLSGELLDMAAITEVGHGVGAVVGWDLAHVVGNVPAALHDWGADFAVWCNYKYVNGGPGAPGGLFVHERYGMDLSVPRLAGWWGTDPAVRFRMESDFVPRAGAEGWAVSTPAILAHAPLQVSLEQFDRVGLPALRDRSRRLTGYLERMLDEVATSRRVRQLTPRDPERRGAQLSLGVEGARELALQLRREHGVVCDVREPDVIRLAPVPLYTTYEDCRRAALALLDLLPPR